MSLPYQVRTENLDELGVTKNDRELFPSTVNVLHVLDPTRLIEGRSEDSGPVPTSYSYPSDYRIVPFPD